MILIHHLVMPSQRSLFHALRCRARYDPGLGSRRRARGGADAQARRTPAGRGSDVVAEQSAARTHSVGVRAGGATPQSTPHKAAKAARYDSCGGANEQRTNERVTTTQSIR